MPYTKEHISRLLDRYHSGTATEQERQELTDWLAAEDDNGAFEEQVVELLHENSSTRHTNVHWEKIFSNIQARKEKTRIIPFWLKTAAAAAVIGLACFLFYQKETPLTPVASTIGEFKPGTNRAVLILGDNSEIVLDSAASGNIAQQGGTQVVKSASGALSYTGNGNAAVMNIMRTPRGGQYQLTLQDGSQVWLNAASSITFPAAFGNGPRIVKISGEVYFEIAKDANRPFLVDIDRGGRVAVLGTSFNINAYADESTMRTTLIEGSVKVLAAGKAAVLSPGEQASMANQELVVNQVDVEPVLAWKNGKLSLTNASVPEIMRQISRWYDIDIKYEGTMPQRHFNGLLNRNVDLAVVLNVLKTYGVSCRMEGKTLIVGTE